MHGWLQGELSAIVASLPAPTTVLDPATLRAIWEGWQADLIEKPELPAELPPLRMLLVLDNLAGHKTPAFVE